MAGEIHFLVRLPDGLTTLRVYRGKADEFVTLTVDDGTAKTVAVLTPAEARLCAVALRLAAGDEA